MPNKIENSGLTPEQIQFFIKLENIFMPHARKQRDEAYKKQKKSSEDKEPIRFVHYTSAEAALNIIKSKRIWMRNTTCMADYREVQHGFDILKKFFEPEKTKMFADALDACIPGAAMEAINLFNQHWNGIQANTYISSISEHREEEDLHGRLSMWRAFGGNTARVAIVFNVPWYSGGAQALNIIFSPVAYLTEKEAHGVIYEVIKNIQENCDLLRTVEHHIIVGMVFNMLLAGVTCLKHDGFREEQEWRAIYSPNLRPSALVECSTEVIGGVPQHIYKLPLDKTVTPILAELDFGHMFDRLIIGPSPYPLVMHEALASELTKAGIVGAEKRVFISGIPIRS